VRRSTAKTGVSSSNGTLLRFSHYSEQKLTVLDRNASTTAPDVLYVVRYRSTYPDIIDGLQRLESSGTVRGQACIEVKPDDARGQADEYWNQIVEHVEARQTDIIVFHHFHSPTLPDLRALFKRLKELPHRPVVAITSGDAFANAFLRPSFPEMFTAASREADVIFSSSIGEVGDYLAAKSGRPVALMPHGLCQARFGQPPPKPAGGARDFRAIFIGSNNRNRNPLKPYHWYARRRERLVKALSKKFGSSFAVFGYGWQGTPGWQGPLPFEEQQEACRRAELVVGGAPFSSARYYTSDRVFIQIASGVPFVDVAVDGIETILRDEEHWYLVPSVQEVVDRCDELLCRPRAERLAASYAAAEYVLSHHTIEDRCRSTIFMLQRYRESLLLRRLPPPPQYDFFLPEVDQRVESSRASRGWELASNSYQPDGPASV
jgi:glycosyltransferase involved in cell wall biosynthesis